MREIQQRVREFLHAYAMDSSQFDIEENAWRFVDEMRRGLKGEAECSLRMIPTFFSPTDRIPTGRPIAVLDAGGTNLRAALVHFSETGEAHVERSSSRRMPGLDREINAEELFREIALQVKPCLGSCDTIAFCFSFASIPTPERDGIVDEMGKQLKVTDIVGQSLANGLNSALRSIGCNAKRIVVLNDSVSTLLGGALSAGEIPYGGYIGFILGTGLNASYVERTGRIGKVAACSIERMIVNTEAGDYNKFTHGVLDEEYDASLMDTGLWQFEKMAAGRYQGGLLRTVINRAIGDGLFPENFCRTFRLVKDLNSRAVDEFLGNPNGSGVLATCCEGAESVDAITLYYLIDEIMERAAKAAAACLTALMLQAEIGANPFYPVCITGDGSTFYKSKLFRGKLEHAMKQCAGDRMGLHYRFNHVPDANLIGSAIAGLTV
jgi:hexokinase